MTIATLVLIGGFVLAVGLLTLVLVLRGSSFGEKGQDELRDAGRPPESYHLPNGPNAGGWGGSAG